MRLFYAINFSDAMKSKLSILRDELREKSVRRNFTATENLHLTLAFLGECDVKQLTAAKAVLDSLLIETMEICVDRIGRFKRDGGDIWWVGVAENEALSAVQKDLTDKLIIAGFRLENRKYSPHITLAREVVTDVQPWRIGPFGEAVCSAELMKSERIQGKLVYTAVHRKSTGGSLNAQNTY